MEMNSQGKDRQEHTIILEMRGVHKRFAGVHALRGINLELCGGKIYHLIGENGCGKSTLIKIISGVITHDEGELLVSGQVAKKWSPIDSLSAGIETVYQDLSLIPNLSVCENIALPEQLVERKGELSHLLDRDRLAATAERALGAVNLPTDHEYISRQVGGIPLAQRQLIAIARAIASQARLVIMDEPTTSLTRREVDNLIHVVQKIRAQGVSVLFVTHKLDECYAIGGEVIVVRDGMKIVQGPINNCGVPALSQMMTGRLVDEIRYRTGKPTDEKLLQVSGLGLDEYFHDVDLEVMRGQILGITGLLDSGRNELARSLAGVLHAPRGTVSIENSVVRLSKPVEAIRAGIGYLPEDRLDEGLFLGKSIEANMVVTVLDRLRGFLGMLDSVQCTNVAVQIVKDLQIATPDVVRPVQSLSGGNQQRVLLGRWLAIEPRILILHSPTVGVDIGSKDSIYRIIQKLASEGLGIIIISDDLPELIQNSDVILVMRKGRVRERFDAENVSQEMVYRAMIIEDETEEAR